MEQCIIATAQDDVGSPFCLDTSDEAFVTSWTRPSNDIMVMEADRLVPVENMLTSQVLSAGYRSDLSNGQTRLCLSYLVARLDLSSFVRPRRDFLCNTGVTGPLESDDLTNIRNNDLIAPLIVNMIPTIERMQGLTEEDFCDDNGRVSILPVMELVMKCLSYILFATTAKSSAREVICGMPFYFVYPKKVILSRCYRMQILLSLIHKMMIYVSNH